MTFKDLGLDPKILKAVEEAGYETPTPIQAQAVPHALEGRDILGIAQTGTGKTASFTLPMLCLLSKGRARARMPRSLILAPTRELAAQVSENFDTYGKYTKLSKALLIGGVSFGEQDKIIDRGVDVLIATPGRLLDHFERGKLMLTGIEIMVIDEADRMLDMGFIEDIERIFKLTPFTRQTLFFSATMPPEITRLTDEFLSNPMRVEVARQATTAETVEQRLCAFTPSRKDRADREKRALLRALIAQEDEGLTNAIVFCNRKRDVSVLFKSLTKHEINAAALHGDLDQRVRMQVLDGFRRGEIKILVASDVAARGLDIPSVSHVFNFDVPMHAEDYVHRIGRTGRAGRDGVAVTLATPLDDKLVAKVEELIKKPIPRVDAPDLPELEERDRDRDRPRDDRQRDDRQRDERGRDGRRRSERNASDARDGGGRRRRSQHDHSQNDGGHNRWDADERSGGDRDEAGRSASRGSRGRDRAAEEDTVYQLPTNRRPDERARRAAPAGANAVIGLGDHVPAFLLREVKAPARRRAADEAVQGDTSLDEASMDEASQDNAAQDFGRDGAPPVTGRPAGDDARAETAEGLEEPSKGGSSSEVASDAEKSADASAEAEKPKAKPRRPRRRASKETTASSPQKTVEADAV